MNITSDLSQIFYKITNNEENHHGFQYKDGLNVLIGSFNYNPTHTCCPGGLYFTDAKHIFKFIDFGCHVREITLPVTDPDFRIVKDPSGDKWRANKIILGKKYDLWNLETIKMLIEKEADIHAMDDYALRSASRYGYFEIIKYLVENGADIHACHNYALIWASDNGCIEIVKYLVEKGADIHAVGDAPLLKASKKGHREIAKYLIENGADVSDCEFYLLKWASFYGHDDIIKYLVEMGVDASADNNTST